MPSEIIDIERGPKGVRCVVKMRFSTPSVRSRTWRSQWFDSGNEGRDFYLARMQMQQRIAEAILAGMIPKR